MSDPAPEGWRRGAQWFGNREGDFSRGAGEYLWVLYTNAPRDKNPHDYDVHWETYEPHTEERTVSEWTSVSEPAHG